MTGMPSSGKTLIGRILAKELGRPFVDIDRVIAMATNKSILEIFEEHGEEYFRKLEAEALKKAANTLTGHVIATGGGAILRDDNVRALKRSGRLYFLNRPLEDLVPTLDRPLSSSPEDLKKRFAERYSRYLSTADCEIVSDNVIAHTVESVKKDFFEKR
jgi:shikimate dehydrogenase